MQGTDTRRSTEYLSSDSPWKLTPIDGSSALLSLGRLQAEAIEATLRYQIEALKFWKNRFEHNLRLLQDMQSRDHVNDAFDLWCSFWQGALLDYSTEGARMADIGSTMATKVAKGLHRDERLLAESMAAQTAM